MKEVMPETILWQTVLTVAADDALHDKTKFKRPYSTFNRRLSIDIDHARSWFKEPNQHFNFVCLSADCNTKAIHERMIKKIKILEEKEKER